MLLYANQHNRQTKLYKVSLAYTLTKLSVVLKHELINSSFHEQFIDASEILVKAEINLL